MLRTVDAGAEMPTIRDLVRTIAQRDGVEAAVVLGRDGLLIEGQTSGDLDGEQLAALTPAIVSAAEVVGSASSRGALITAVFEFELGMGLVFALSTDVVLLVVLHPSANIGSLLFDLRRHRANIASIV
jgi:predicted regulator of Ras-like GTPase activity (Roadblock/LC7/MglB family)